MEQVSGFSGTTAQTVRGVTCCFAGLDGDNLKKQHWNQQLFLFTTHTRLRGKGWVTAELDIGMSFIQLKIQRHAGVSRIKAQRSRTESPEVQTEAGSPLVASPQQRTCRLRTPLPSQP